MDFNAQLSYADRMQSSRAIHKPRKPFNYVVGDMVQVVGGPGLGIWQAQGIMLRVTSFCCLVSFYHPKEKEHYRHWFDQESGVRHGKASGEHVKIDMPETAIDEIFSAPVEIPDGAVCAGMSDAMGLAPG